MINKMKKAMSKAINNTTMTNTEIALKIGVHRHTVQRICNDYKAVSLETMVAAMIELGIEFDYIIGELRISYHKEP